MSDITGFMISVAASIVAHYVCKWLDRDNEDRQPTLTKSRGHSRGFSISCCQTLYWLQLHYHTLQISCQDNLYTICHIYP